MACEARRIAKQEVVDQIKRRGDKLRYYSHKQLTLMAEDYIAGHREEITREMVMRRAERWFKPMRLQSKPKPRRSFWALILGGAYLSTLAQKSER